MTVGQLSVSDLPLKLQFALLHVLRKHDTSSQCDSALICDIEAIREADTDRRLLLSVNELSLLKLMTVPVR